MSELDSLRHVSSFSAMKSSVKRTLAVRVRCLVIIRTLLQYAVIMACCMETTSGECFNCRLSPPPFPDMKKLFSRTIALIGEDAWNNLRSRAIATSTSSCECANRVNFDELSSGLNTSNPLDLKSVCNQPTSFSSVYSSVQTTTSLRSTSTTRKTTIHMSPSSPSSSSLKIPTLNTSIAEQSSTTLTTSNFTVTEKDSEVITINTPKYIPVLYTSESPRIERSLVTIIVGAVGGLAIIFVVFVLIICLYRRKKRELRIRRSVDGASNPVGANGDRGDANTASKRRVKGTQRQDSSSSTIPLTRYESGSSYDRSPPFPRLSIIGETSTDDPRTPPGTISRGHDPDSNEITGPHVVKGEFGEHLNGGFVDTPSPSKTPTADDMFSGLIDKVDYLQNGGLDVSTEQLSKTIHDPRDLNNGLSRV